MPSEECPDETEQEDIFDFIFADTEMGRKAAEDFREAHENGEFSVSVEGAEDAE